VFNYYNGIARGEAEEAAVLQILRKLKKYFNSL